MAISQRVWVGLEQATATIAESASLSAAVEMEDRALLRMTMPSAWTAANLTVQVSYDGITYSNLYDHLGNEYTITAAAGREIVVPVSDFMGVRYLKVRSGTSGTPVTQASARTITLTTRVI